MIVVGLMMLQTYSKIPLYRASARVQIQDERTTAVGNLNSNDPMFWQDSEQYYNTQYSILRSRGLARRVVQRLQLQNHPLFNGSAPQSRGPLSAVREARKALGTSVRGLFSGAKTTTTTIDQPAADESAVESALISQFLGGVEIVPEKATRLVEIVYVSPSPEFAALAATTLAEEYAQQNIDLRLETINKNLLWLGDEVSQAGKEGHRSRDGDGALPRTAERALARRSPEHRRLASEHAERHGDARAHGAPAEGSQLQPGEVGRSQERRGRRLPGHLDQPGRDGSQDAGQRPDGREGAARRRATSRDTRTSSRSTVRSRARVPPSSPSARA